LTKEQTESFNKNPRFIGLKFPDVSKPETLEKKYTGKLSTKALSLMIGLLKMDPSQRLNGEQALMHEYFDDVREPDDMLPVTDNSLMSTATRPIYSS
jgi:cyclin-dependent kinase-like